MSCPCHTFSNKEIQNHSGAYPVSDSKWQKPSEKLVELFEQIVPKSADIDRRKMFGLPCAFKNGNMFTGLHNENMILRLSESDRKAFLNLDQARQFEPMPGRFMKEYVVVPPSLLNNIMQLEDWIKKSLAYVSGLPPKVKKRDSHARITKHE